MHASLFSGLGGFDLAAEWMGWENKFSCEIDPFCQRVLRHHFSSTHNYGDIRELDGTKYRGQIDVLTGGFPCQPFSVAGERRGEDDARFLWPEMLRVIREVQPSWIIAENVRGITSIENGMVFERVCSELEANGYDVQALCIPACAVNAPHRRDRMWFIANNNSERRKRSGEEEICGERRLQGSKDERRFAPIPDRSDLYEPNLCGRCNGLSERLDALGNAIVPQIAYKIFQAISQAHNG